MVLSEQLYRADESISLLKGGNDLIVAGYASVELVDKQGDIITRGALKDAFRKFMEDPKYRNVQLAHSNIQVGEVIPNYTDAEGRLWKSEVDDVGMFVVVQLRNDIEKAKEVSAEIRKGGLRGFSIGGQAFKRMRKSDPKRGDYQEISKLELHEITICEKGINPEATFSILKEDTGEKMTDENDDMMKQMSDVLSRLEGRLESLEGDSVDKGEMPAGLKEHMADKKESKDDKEKAMMDKDKKDDDKEKGMYGKAVHGDDAKKSEEFSDVISSEYLNWMEDTLKSGGVDIDGARAHFDDLEKANLGSTPESIGDGADYFGGQVKGRAQESGSPSTGAVGKLGTGGGEKEVKKSDYLDPAVVSDADVEAAYEVYKAAALEQDYRLTLEKQFASRYASEREEEIAKAEAAAYDARGPLADIQKSIEALSERIESVTSSPEIGEAIQKSAEAPSVTVPSTEDLASMSWSEVHNLATRAFNPE